MPNENFISYTKTMNCFAITKNHLSGFTPLTTGKIYLDSKIYLLLPLLFKQISLYIYFFDIQYSLFSLQLKYFEAKTRQFSVKLLKVTTKWS